MWLHTPKGPDATSGGLALAHEFSIWLLSGGKPTLTRSSEIDWPKSSWLGGLDLWEPPHVQNQRVLDHLASVGDRPGMRVLGLCAGYGGLESAVHIACGAGARTVGHVERQAYAAAVLAARMKEGSIDEAPVWDDLETFDCTPWRGHVDIVVGGIPCQGASVAGKRLGVDDERWLWSVFWRIVQETEARYFLLENVPGLLSVNGGRAFQGVLRDLGASGWAAEWDCVPAATVGAPHLRDRLFVLAADAHRIGVRIEPKRRQRKGRCERAAQRWNAQPAHAREGRASADADVYGVQASERGRAADGLQGRAEAGSGGSVEAPDAHHEPSGAQQGIESGEWPDAASGGSPDASDADRQAGESHRRAQREEPRDPQGEGEPDPDATRERCDQGARVDPDPRSQGGTDARGGCEHGAPAHTRELGLQADQREIGGDLRPTERYEPRPIASRGDQPAPRARDASDAHRHGREGERGSGKLDSGFGSQRGSDVDRRRGSDVDRRRGSDVDRRRGPGAGHAYAIGERALERLAQFVQRGRDTWDWNGAPSAVVRSVDDGGPERLVGDTHADQLHLLGNGVVPLCAAYAFTILWDRLIGADLDVPDDDTDGYEGRR